MPFRRLLARLISKEGYPAFEAASEEAALRLLERERPGGVILDWCLRGRSGLDVLRGIRRRRSLAGTRVILYSAVRETVEDEAAALAAGADLFLSKTEITASPSAFLRHLVALLAPAARRRVRLGRFELDPATGRLAGPNFRRLLNPQEARLLELLARHQGRLVSRESLWSEVWDRPSPNWPHLLSNRMSTLRAKLGPLAGRLVCRKDEGFALTL